MTMALIRLSTLSAEYEEGWDPATDAPQDFYVLYLGETEVARWPVRGEGDFIISERDRGRYAEEFIADKLADLFTNTQDPS